MIKNIIFDIGEVLVSFRPDGAMRDLGISEEIIPKLMELTVKSNMWGMLDKGVLPESEINRIMIESAGDYGSEMSLFLTEGRKTIVHSFDYSREWLWDLKNRGFKLYLLTNYPGEYFNYHYEHGMFSFADLVDGMVVSARVNMVKPNRDIYEHLLSKYSLKAEECVFIDDRQENVDGAKAVGICGIRFSGIDVTKKELEQLISKT